MLSQLAGKNVVVFRGTAKDAIDMQLCQMGIVPYTTYAYSEGRTNNDISKKFMNGLAKISEKIGKPGLEHVAYKGIGGTGNGNRYYHNEQMNKYLEALSQKEFFEFFFTQNSIVSKLKEKLLEDAKQYTTDSNELYTFIGGAEQTEVIDEIRAILGTDRINETITAYNEKATLEFEQRYKDYVSKLPEIKKQEAQNIHRQEQTIEQNLAIGDLTYSSAVANHTKQKTTFYSNIGSQIPLSAVIEYSREIKPLFDKVEHVQSQNHSTSKVHGIQHVKNVLLLSNYLGLMNGVSYKDLAILRESAIYHDICHERPADPTHAKLGANWYLKNVDSDLNKEEVAYLIEAHELNGKKQFSDLAVSTFPNITEKRKAELIRCAEILQDADRLDILRYDIENPNEQRFSPSRLNNPQNAELISAVIELNTRQAINKGYLQIKDGKVCLSEKAKLGQEQKGKAKFEESTLNSELQELSSETTISGFNEMSSNIRNVQKSNEQEQMRDGVKTDKKDEGWDVDDE